MGAAGILRPDEQLELIEGVIVVLSSIGIGHAACLGRLLDWCIAHLPMGTIALRVQDPLRLLPRSEPQPDLAVVRRRPNRYASGHPEPADVTLLMEVSDTTFAYDRNRKLPLYAAAGIPEVWIWDLARAGARVCRRPEGRRYTETTVVARGASISPLAFPSGSVAVDEILG